MLLCTAERVRLATLAACEADVWAAGSSVGDVGQYTPGEAARLTASVLRSALPMHQRINVAALGGSRA